MSPRYIIGVVHAQHVAAGKRQSFVAFSHGKESAVRNLDVGDKVIFYAPKTEFDGAPVQAFVGHATITGAAPRQADYMTGMPAWVRDAQFDDVTEVPVRPLLEELSFITRPSHWGMSFRQGKFAISEVDYRLIAKAMGVTI
ncbi:EVE domain-containing protein [uncultured Litoreibacter sp.]|uniref:EVE domain-containing protein n=1 Tax=uncultured Litoreibacter sp. TaxID=1392394 RepID=UPI002623EF74|nr:EVE domain-containing protein [uncultured Litoreibacter sp.]